MTTTVTVTMTRLSELAGNYEIKYSEEMEVLNADGEHGEGCILYSISAS